MQFSKLLFKMSLSSPVLFQNKEISTEFVTVQQNQFYPLVQQNNFLTYFSAFLAFFQSTDLYPVPITGKMIVDHVVPAQMALKKKIITYYAVPILYNPVWTEVVHLCYKVLRIYSFFFCNEVHYSLTKHLATLPTDMEGNFTRSCDSNPPDFMCTHTLLRQRRLQLDGMWSVTPMLALCSAIGFVKAFDFIFSLVFSARCKGRRMVRGGICPLL